MPSTAEPPPRDPGLARERTALSWQRMALSFTSLAAVTLAAAAHRQRVWMLVPAGLLFALGAAVWLYARRRIGDPGLPTARLPIVLLAGAALLAALAAGVLAAVAPG
jgi:uncharacterized membrane protein YidH (DUF202 family)